MEKSDESKFYDANDLIDEGKLSKALIILEHLYEKYPQNIELTKTIAYAYWKLKEYSKIAEFSEKVIRINPKDELFSRMLYVSLHNLGEIDKAFKEAERFLTISYSKEYEDMLDEIINENKKNNE